jgi:hypothetical protein
LAEVGNKRVGPVAFDPVEAVLCLRITERFTGDLPAHERYEYVRRATREGDIDRSPGVIRERLRWQPVGVRGHVSRAAVDAKHRTGHAVRDIERPVGTDRAPDDEVVAADLGKWRHDRAFPVVGAGRRRGHRDRLSSCD